MEVVYKKLYDKYSKLKTKKLSHLDYLNKEQELRFVNFLSAAEVLIEHLKSEKEELLEHVNDLRTELASLRHVSQFPHCSLSLIFHLEELLTELVIDFLENIYLLEL